MLSSYILSARGCSAKNHPHLLKKLPKIFTFSPDKVKSDKLCSKQSKLLKKSDREYSSCHLVDVNLHSFLAPTASICLIPSSISTNSVEDGDDCSQVNLIKSSQLGLDVAVQSSLSPATAQVGQQLIALGNRYYIWCLKYQYLNSKKSKYLDFSISNLFSLNSIVFIQ